MDANWREIPPRPITWSSSDPQVVSVDTAGWLRGVSLGTATVTASAEGARSASIPVRVERGYTATEIPLTAHDVNSRGRVAGLQGSRPALWHGGKLLWTGPVATTGSVGVNDSGHVAGTWTRRAGERLRGFVWKDGKFRNPYDLTVNAPALGYFRFGIAINERGQMLVRSSLQYYLLTPAP